MLRLAMTPGSLDPLVPPQTDRRQHAFGRQEPQREQQGVVVVEVLALRAGDAVGAAASRRAQVEDLGSRREQDPVAGAPHTEPEIRVAELLRADVAVGEAADPAEHIPPNGDVPARDRLSLGWS